MNIKDKLNKNVFEEEIFVKYILPAYRRELVLYIIERDCFTQKRISKILNVTEGAVSQWVNKKRGVKLNFNSKELRNIADEYEQYLEGKYLNINEMISSEGMILAVMYKRELGDE